MQFLTILKLIISLLPILIDTIKLVEKSFSGQGQGRIKLATTKAVLEATYSTSKDVAVEFETVWPSIEKTIGGIVSTFNATGVFGK